MSRVGWLTLILVMAGGAVAAVPRTPVKVLVRGAVDLLPANDPFPIRRVAAVVILRLPDLLKEFEPGPVVRVAANRV